MQRERACTRARGRVLHARKIKRGRAWARCILRPCTTRSRERSSLRLCSCNGRQAFLHAKLARIIVRRPRERARAAFDGGDGGTGSWMPSSDSKSLSVRLSNTSPSTRLRLNCSAYCRTQAQLLLARLCVAYNASGVLRCASQCYVAASAARRNAFCESGDASMLGTSGMPRSPSQAITCCWSQPSKPAGAAAPKPSTVPQAHADMCRVDPWGRHAGKAHTRGRAHRRALDCRMRMAAAAMQWPRPPSSESGSHATWHQSPPHALVHAWHAPKAQRA